VLDRTAYIYVWFLVFILQVLLNRTDVTEI